MHWADVIAKELAIQGNKHNIATGITPSGPIHIGNMREILSGETVFRALKDSYNKIDVTLYFIGDTIDPLRKLYPFLDEGYKRYIGMSLYEIPCPCGNHDNYAHHFSSPFFDALESLNVQYELLYSHELYQEGKYADSIRTIIKNKELAREILVSSSGRELPENWYPFNPKCNECKRITTTTVTGFEDPYILFECECGHSGKADIRKDDGKLPWRLDWPARWNFLDITCEPYGKDHATVGGSYDTGAKIIRQIFKREPPYSVIYEWIQLKGKGAMASSTGVVVTAAEMLDVTPPEVLRFLMVKSNPTKHIDFDPGLGILALVDDLDRYERIFYDKEEGDDPEDQKRTYELAQTHEVQKDFPRQIPYRHLVNLIQIDDDWDAILSRLKRAEHFDNLTEFETTKLKQRLNCVRNWLDKFAPENVKFQVQRDLPDVNLTDVQVNFLKKLGTELSECVWESEIIHDTIYATAKSENIKPRIGFIALYKVILGKEQGPRLGYFLGTLDKEFVLDRLAEVLNHSD